MDLLRLLDVDCDVELKLDDCKMPANSTTLRMISSVFSDALAAETGWKSPKQNRTSACSGGSSSNTKTTIPLLGITREQWLRIAEFLYPVVPSPTIEDWKEAEFLLEVGKKFDLKLLLHKVDLYLDSRADEMYHCQGSKSTPEDEDDTWKWFRLADGAGLQVCLPAIARRIMQQCKATCAMDEYLQGLSPAGWKELLKAAVSRTR